MLETVLENVPVEFYNCEIPPNFLMSFYLSLCSDLKGVIVTLSDSGHLQCSYLGTDPSLFQAPKVESREINYEELDIEMKELQKIIKEATKTQGTPICHIVVQYHHHHLTFYIALFNTLCLCYTLPYLTVCRKCNIKYVWVKAFHCLLITNVQTNP